MITDASYREPPKAGDRNGIKRLLSRHFKIIEMALAGHNNTAIAKAFSMSKQSITMIMNSPLVQQEMARRRSESDEAAVMELDRDAHIQKARMVMDKAVEKAAQTQVDLLESDNDSVRLRAADRLLDRVFGTTKDQAPIVQITAEQIQLLNLAAQETTDVETEQSADVVATHPEVVGEGHVHEEGQEGQPADGSGCIQPTDGRREEVA